MVALVGEHCNLDKIRQDRPGKALYEVASNSKPLQIWQQRLTQSPR
jgi:hypothetical protein